MMFVAFFGFPWEMILLLFNIPGFSSPGLDNTTLKSMTNITKEIDSDLDLTIYSVIGDFKIITILEVLDQFYQSNYTLNLAWNFSKANTSEISRDDIDSIINHAKAYAHLRKNGKTAFIVSNDISFGLGRMYETVAEISNHTISHNVFRSIEEAINWVKNNEH